MSLIIRQLTAYHMSCSDTIIYNWLNLACRKYRPPRTGIARHPRAGRPRRLNPHRSRELAVILPARRLLGELIERRLDSARSIDDTRHQRMLAGRGILPLHVEQLPRVRSGLRIDRGFLPRPAVIPALIQG